MANINIYGRLHNNTDESVVTGADEVYDDALEKKQSDINADLKAADANGAAALETAKAALEGKIKSNTDGIAALSPAPATISHVYAGFLAMNNDTNPQSDMTKAALKKGEFVIVNSSDRYNGNVYRYNGAGSDQKWTFIKKIDAQYILKYEANSYILTTTAGESAVIMSYNLERAVNAIPSPYRKAGFKVTFEDIADSTWKTYQFQSEDLSLWGDLGKWHSVEDDINGLVGSSAHDLALSDESGNNIAVFDKGGFRTRDFDSGKSPQTGSSAHDLALSDESGNNIAVFDKGGFRTRDFDSSKVPTRTEMNEAINNHVGGGGTGGNYLPRPKNGKAIFEVKVNVNLPLLDTDAKMGDSYKEGTDYGYISLPANYTPNGTPVRLMIQCHGAGTAKSFYTDPNAAPPTMGTSFSRLGLAVMDMYAAPKEVTGSDMDELHFGNPVTLQCYVKGINYVLDHYNVKKDGIFVSGVSMGGLSSFQIVQSGLFHVLAHVGICPCIDLFKQAYCNPWAGGVRQRSSIARYFGFTGVAPAWSESKPPTKAEIDYFVANFDKAIGYYPIVKNLTSGDLMNVFAHIPRPIAANNNATDEEADYASLVSYHPCPLKIFHCKDDPTVAFRYSKYFIGMVRRGGQAAFLRPYSTGGHAAWDAGESMEVTDVEGNKFMINSSRYEAYLFFNRYN